MYKHTLHRLESYIKSDSDVDNTDADTEDATSVAEAATAAGGVCFQSSIMLVTV